MKMFNVLHDNLVFYSKSDTVNRKREMLYLYLYIYSNIFSEVILY